MKKMEEKEALEEALAKANLKVLVLQSKWYVVLGIIIAILVSIIQLFIWGYELFFKSNP